MSLPSALARGSSCSFARVLASRASSLGCYRSVSSFFEPGAPASARHSGPESGSDSGGKKEDEEQGKPRRSRFPSKVLRPESPVHWNLSDTMKKSDSIPVFSTVSNPDDASSATTKPLSMWPGMYHSPVTAALWNARSTILERAWLAPSDGPPQTTIMTKTPEESRTSILYALSTDKILREQYRNPWQGVRIGKLLEDLDALAGTIAVKVTLSAIDCLSFISRFFLQFCNNNCLFGASEDFTSAIYQLFMELILEHVKRSKAGSMKTWEKSREFNILSS